MDNEARLLRALNAGAAPARDPAFTLAVMRRAEEARFRAETVRSVLRGAGLAAAAAALAVPLMDWAAANGAALKTGGLAAAALLTLVWAARIMTQRLAAAWVR
jgi:hypothetical protein